MSGCRTRALGRAEEGTQRDEARGLWPGRSGLAPGAHVLSPFLHCFLLPRGRPLDFKISFHQQLLQSGILAFEFFQPGCVRRIHATVFTAPAGEGRFTDRLLATQHLNRCLSRFRLMQNGDNVGFRKSSGLHCLLLVLVDLFFKSNVPKGGRQATCPSCTSIHSRSSQVRRGTFVRTWDDLMSHLYPLGRPSNR